MAEQRTNNSSCNGTVCHILPCSIEEDMTAPVAQYFHPTPLPSNFLPKNEQGADDNDDGAPKNNANATIMAAQFRGRGLLCAVDASTAPAPNDSTDGPSVDTETTTLSKLPSTLIGVALSQSSSSRSSNNNASISLGANTSKDPPTQPLKVIETFQHVYNWSHEHDVQKIMRDRHGSDKNGLNAVMGWCDLSHDVHDPIPVPP
mmetsp:Transcript_24730/g.52454  ORF Transcript_24730/g.52454 Transcript_24730/m.52454 type:complete len:203 (-) Transcript_24730:136-744(-)